MVRQIVMNKGTPAESVFTIDENTMWCEACGTVTNDRKCDCTELKTGTQRLRLYATVETE